MEEEEESLTKCSFKEKRADLFLNKWHLVTARE
jgi:hypothetical protein